MAWSTPRLSSAIRAQLLVANTRISVPCAGGSATPSQMKRKLVPTISLAVAMSSPSGLISIALRGEE